MKPFNLRSLLLAAFVLSNCITWTTSRHHYTHNFAGHRSRHRRQGQGLFLSGSYVIPGGEGYGWGEWGDVSPCSRTCGGGVASQKRICLQIGPNGQPRCSGGDTKYFSCQTQDCPAGSKDFRAEQCSEFDDVSFRNIKYKWEPYTKAPNPCELNCMPHGERFYYRHKTKVVDGTKCNDESFDVCVNGTCQPVGCDMMLGSNAREDKCRECRGNNVNCHTTNGIIDTQDLRKGYNDLMLIPEGATNIVIAEVGPSKNYLALRAKNGTYYLNGDYHIDFPRSMIIGGALWYYERDQQGFAAPDKLKCLGPTNEILYLALLLQDYNVGIEYEYSVPTDLAPPRNKQYIWVHDEFTPCNVSCAGGIQTRNVTCRTREELELVDEGLCDAGMKPPINQTCNTQACPAQWVPGPWSKCSKRCGEGGFRNREVTCQKIVINGYYSIVEEKECIDYLPKPEVYQKCNENATCPIWFAGPWKPCDHLCDEGKQTRQVVCYQKDGRRIEVLGDEECEGEKPSAEKKCMLQPCEGVDWVLTDWIGCDSCLSINRTRTAVCATKDHKVVDDKFCSYHNKSITEEPCDKTKLPACEVQWYSTQWSKCSVECGKGVQSRKVFCGLFDGASVVKVDDTRCKAQDKYNDTKPCEIPKEKCPSQWYAGPWSICTKTSEGEKRYRRVMCLRGSEPAKDCDEEAVLDSNEPCTIEPYHKDDMDSTEAPESDDYEDCEEEDYPEVGLDADGGDEGFSKYDSMFSDMPFEGSGFSASTYAELESEFTDKDSFSYDELITVEGSGVTSSETDITEESTSTDITVTGDETTDTTDTGETETTSSNISTSDGTTEAGETTTMKSTTNDGRITLSTRPIKTDAPDADDIDDDDYDSSDTETTSTESLGTTESDNVSGSTSDGTTETGETGSDLTTESELTVTTETGDTSDTSSTEATESTETDNSESTEQTESTTVSDTSSTESTETTEAITTDSSVTTQTTESTETTETVSTESIEPTETGSTESVETTETGSTESTETTETGSTESTEQTESTSESNVTSESESTESTETTASLSTESTETTVSSSTESSETTASGSTESTETIESSSTELTGTTETGSTEVSVTTESTESTETTETEKTESTETTETGSTESTETTASGSTETTETGSTETTESTISSEGSESTFETSESSITESSEGLTTWGWDSTIEMFTTKKPRLCRPRLCKQTEFGCCPDKKSIAHGPFDEGCKPKDETCNDTKFGCCPDGVSPAKGPKGKGCPVEPCAETLFGCCLSDNKTASQGNDQEGCPPPPPACQSSKYGCCVDGETEATGPKKQGCPETTEGTELPVTAATTTTLEGKSCAELEFGCCFDNETAATGPDSQGCPCTTTKFGCCPDGVATAQGPALEGCKKTCNSSTYGCCPDGKTPAHGYDNKGCCLLYSFGCCPDNHKPAEGPHLEGCGCQYSQHGCCPDNVTIASGPNNQGCGCQFTEHGCCPDKHTEATGPDFEGCACHTYQFGCCPDGVTIAIGPNGQGCLCQLSKFGCCGDDLTHATGPNQQGCDCSTSKYGCCPDGFSEAKGPKFLGCSDIPENKQAACSLSYERGNCTNYSVYWYYDTGYGGCSRFWYGGCGGNGNRFASKEECEDVCVRPPLKDACKLPQVKGACSGYNVRWFYDSQREMCTNFVYGGCLGNNNNFETRDACQAQCEPERAIEQCDLPIERGSCAGNFPRFGFNKNTRTCEQFIWGGCEGNTNRFSTEAACLHHCNPPGEPKPECLEPQDVGNCSDTYATWSFSQSENRCVPFYYTGCGGNNNKFDSIEACQESCPSAYVPDMCTLPAEIGECAHYTEKWYFDTKDQRCRQFYYGGCGGNSNNFNSEHECTAKCIAPVTTTTVRPQTQPQPETRPPAQHEGKTDFCFQPLDPGPCTDVRTRWGYDYTQAKCVSFQYGGCGGNRNNFPDETYCQYYCRVEQDVCQMPMLSGPCNESQNMWFYDTASDSCSQFAYGGCDGNDNRFETREACETRCKTGPSENLTPATTTTTAPPRADIPEECIISGYLEECRADTAGQVWYLDQNTHQCVSYDNLPTGDGCRVTGIYKSEEACERACGAFRNLDVCRYPLNPGNCNNFVAKYFFNASSARCEEFAYSGCVGGPNRFSTAQECEDICAPLVDPCKQPVEVGDCPYRYDMWYYDQYADACNQFIYGGCGGNHNKFESRELCEKRCVKSPGKEPVTTTTTAAPQIVPAECTIPESLAPCGNNVSAFYYDPEASACKIAGIGACPYYNNYRTEEECERRCGAFRGIDVCQAQLDAGPCRAAIPKFYFDAASGTCKDYIYGGCQGGANRFSSIEECKEVCGNAGPDSDQQSRICDQYSEECLRLETPGACQYGISVSVAAEGCERCACAEPPDCMRQQDQCRRLDCKYGVERRMDSYGCEECNCAEDPCSRTNCSSTERCVAVAYRDPATHQVQYSAHCVPETDTNEVSEECAEYKAACERLSCPYSVQVTRTARGCERCACVPEEVDCAALRRDCELLKCNYGKLRTLGDDGCERCQCKDPPCTGQQCQDGERCVTSSYRDPLTEEVNYVADCRPVNKNGSCPAQDGHSTEGSCRRECNDDADCRGVGKCCARGCSQLCLTPTADLPTTVQPQTTHAPDIPQAPQLSEETEPQVTATEGGKAVLRCIFHGNPPPKITWRRGEIVIDDDIDRYRLLSDGTLEIVSLYRNDSGVYICIGENDLGVARQEIVLQVNDPVETAAGIAGEPGATVIGEYGQHIVIRCLVYGYPEPSVYWYRGLNGPLVPFGSHLYEYLERGRALLIRKLTVDTLGEYQCQAYNGIGKPSTWLVVVRAFQSSEEYIDSPYIVPRDGVVAVTPRERTTITTTTTTSTTAPEFEFRPFTVPVHTALMPAATSLVVGSELTLPCEVDGFPEPQVTWTKNNVRLVPSDRMWITNQRLTIQHAELNDTGEYGCHASNSYSSHESKVQITVKEVYIPAKCTDSPYFANCALIVQGKFCKHTYYSRFCCKSCVQAGQLNFNDIEMQADEPFRKK